VQPLKLEAQWNTVSRPKPGRQIVHPDVELKLIVLASHLSPQFGYTVREIEREGISDCGQNRMSAESGTDTATAETVGVATVSLADTLAPGSASRGTTVGV
jgi:hypothetical protein